MALGPENKLTPVGVLTRASSADKGWFFTRRSLAQFFLSEDVCYADDPSWFSGLMLTTGLYDLRPTDNIKIWMSEEDLFVTDISIGTPMQL